MNFLDIFSDDAFSLASLVKAINELDHVPGRAGEVVFTQLGPDEVKGVPNIRVSIERQGESLTLIPSSPRGGPAPKELQDKRGLIPMDISQIKLEDTIQAHSIMNVREFGSSDLILGAVNAVQKQMQKMTRRHDLTLENLRLGALRGVLTDADGSVLLDLFQAFDVLNSDGLPGPDTIDFDLENFIEPTFEQSVRVKCQNVVRLMTRRAKCNVSQAKVWAFAGDAFFDKLISHPSVKRVHDGTESAKQALGDNYAFRVFEMGGIFFENYRGTDDSSATVGIADDEARFFFTGVPGLYGEYFAPADFMETVNTPGLPRYAKIALDARFQQHVELHTQQNPLPICLRPQTLMRGIVTA